MRKAELSLQYARLADDNETKYRATQVIAVVSCPLRETGASFKQALSNARQQ